MNREQFTGRYTPSDTEAELWSLIGKAGDRFEVAETMRGQSGAFNAMQKRTRHPYFGKLIRARNYVSNFFEILNDDGGVQ